MKIDLHQIVKEYVSRMVSRVEGMKTLVLDTATTPIVSMTFTQTEVLDKDVLMLDRIDNDRRERMGHLRGIFFVRPSEENIALLCKELKSPLYGEYYLYFSNVVSREDIDQLAVADENELVKEVQEFYADYLVVNSDFFLIPDFNPVDTLFTWSPREEYNVRIAKHIFALLLSLKKNPIVRYLSSSPICEGVATSLARMIEEENELFDFRSTERPCVILIMSRQEDPITPLLNQWTYQGMIHEMIGITHNRVIMKQVPGIRKDMEEVTLSQQEDLFYRRNMYLNYGDLGDNLRTKVESYQEQTVNKRNIQNLEDMRDFIESYPQFRAESNTVSKHVAICGELSRQIDLRNLFEISRVEQSLACTHGESSAFRVVKELISRPQTHPRHALSLVVLYAIRYEERRKIKELEDILRVKGVPEESIALVRTINAFSPKELRPVDLLRSRMFERLTDKISRGIKGMENIYTQHQPYLSKVLELLSEGKLKTERYPYADEYSESLLKEKHGEVIVFFVGGATFEEALLIHEANYVNKDVNFILGGTSCHNSSSFIRELEVFSKSQVHSGLR